ncbi:UNVERIFIED_CONTAM: Retrovirus-related Pol polyprotein from transposon.6 [Sesamum radiatum]|uniref:Retrovirus-related Pol polyprotein from transposon.6 n=1 Tax=Sesamum radiatum TaxID=300843 RepID=A0AAW2LNH6_SESRA
MLVLPTLSLPDFTQPFQVTTDASQIAIGAVLSQACRPIAFFSKKMSSRMQSASAYEREMFAITEAVRKWRHYLLGRKFHIFTDQQSLRSLLTQTVQTPAQHKWLSKLLGFDYEIFYTPGKENVVADALSRHSDACLSSFLAVSTATSALLQELRDFYSSHPAGVSLLQTIRHSPSSRLVFSDAHGLVLLDNHLFIPLETGLRPTLLSEFHCSPLGVTRACVRLCSRLAASFFWPKMRSDVKAFVLRCSTCQTSKYSTQRPIGTLQPLPVPQRVWDDLSMDFITHLPLSHGKSVIWVVVDRLTKYAHFIGLPPRFSASSLAGTFAVEIYRLHSMPRSIVSDRDPLFLSTFWCELFRLSGTRLAFSSAYHPQSDGQTEVLNRVLETYLRCFVNEEPCLWFRFLHLAEFWYNSSHHSSIGMSPFHALYGRPPPSFVPYISGSSTVASLEDSLRQR